MKESRYNDGMVDATTSIALIEGCGMLLLAIYHVLIIIVLVNMLIAMMSHSFEIIQVCSYFLIRISLLSKIPLWIRLIKSTAKNHVVLG